MGLLDLLIGRSANPVPTETETKNVRGVEVKVLEIGSTGTEIYAGYLAEEYLKELTGKEWADKVDMMRRSDANVRMVLNAIKLPLKSSPWNITTKEKTEAAELQKKLFEKILFQDLNKSFTQLVGEILTCLEFGYSIFDITHAVKKDDEVGGYNGLKSLAYRSQRTIDRWNLNDSADLETVTQIAYGDEGGSYELDARFLLYFAPEREGDNFEGISVLRACYGPWFRKNEFLKKLAIGIEKFAVPTAVLTVPEGTEGKPEMAAAKKALQCYTSGSTNYLILPKGFELTFNNVSVDVEKIRSAINAENQEMVNSILASFLLLGQNGAGSLALSGTLSDFFSQTIQYIADHISEQFERKIFKPLCQMNFGNDKVLVELTCDGLEHRANEAWATMVNGFISSGAIKADEDLEVNLREKLKLPPKKELIQESVPSASTPTDNGVSLAEKKKSSETPESKLIKKTSNRIRIAGQKYLPYFAKKYIRSIMIAKGKSNEPDQIKAPLAASVPSLSTYRNILAPAYMIAKIETDDIQNKLFKTGAKKLSEFRLAAGKFKRVSDAVNEYEMALQRLLGAEGEEDIDDAIYALGRISDKVALIFSDYISPSQKKNILAKVDVFSETQQNDILKSVDLQYQSSLIYADNDELEQDMFEAADKAISGPMTMAGPDVQASQTVNDGLMEAAEKYAEETGDEIISWTFVAVEDTVPPQTNLCNELDGATFAASDPDAFKYTPPLHFNCRSFMQVNTTRTKNNPPITGLPKLTVKAQNQLQFSETQLGGPGSGCHGDNCGRPPESDSNKNEEKHSKNSNGKKKQMTQISEHGAIKMKQPRNTDEASDLLDEMNKHFDAASKHFKDNPNDGFAAMRFNHTYKQVEKALRWAKKVNEKKLEETTIFEFAEYKGKKVELDKPFRTPDGPKKFAVYVKNDKGNVVMVRFGDPNMEIKRDDPARRKNFRARHKCDTDPGPKWKARYWSCKFWSTENVGDLI